MICPKCETAGKILVKRCRACGQAYSVDDLLEYRQLEFFIAETADWEGVSEKIQPLRERLELLKERLGPSPQEAVPDLEPEPPPIIEPAPAPQPIEVKPPAPPKEKVPFDQWLLSETNIKIALYSGAILLVLAGIIFIGVNWIRFSGGVKFLTTSLVTCLTYFGGYLLFKRPALKLGGISLLSIACGFFVLNFGVLQIYVLSDLGLSNELMWLYTSPVCLLLYLLTAYWTKTDVFTYFSMIGLGSTLAALLVVLSAPILAYPLFFSFLMIFFFGLSTWQKMSRFSEFTALPLSLVSQLLMPVLQIAALNFFINESGCSICSNGSPWWPITTFLPGLAFYIFVDLKTERKEPRWAEPILSTIFVAFFMHQLGLGKLVSGIVLMILALGFLGIGYLLERRGNKLAGVLSFYVMTYVIATYLTISAIGSSSSVINLVIVLFGDVLILGITAVLRNKFWWLYGAAVLVIIPVYLLADLYLVEKYYQSLVMVGLGAIQLMLGYLLGRKHLSWGGAFLSGAALLSVISLGLAVKNLQITTLVLILWAAAYVFVAIWQRWPWLLSPGIVYVFGAIASLNFAIIPNLVGQEILNNLTISYSVTSIITLIIGRKAAQIPDKDWTWPLYILGGFVLVGAYVSSLFIGGWIALGITLASAALFLIFAHYAPIKFVEVYSFPILPYLGLGSLFISHFFLMSELDLLDIWPVLTAGICALFTALAGYLRAKDKGKIIQPALWIGGISLLVIPLAGTIILAAPWISSITFLVAAIILLWDAVLRRSQLLSSLGLAALFIGHFYLINDLGLIDIWPVITISLCGIYAIAAWVLRGHTYQKTFELPLRLGGLGLMIIPLGGSLILTAPWIGAVSFLVAGTIYLVDAGLRSYNLMAYLGIGSLFLANFCFIAALDSMEFWPLITLFVTVISSIISWMLRGKKFADIYELPLRLAGLALMLIPAVGSLFGFDHWIPAVVLSITGLVYFVDAGIRNLALMSLPAVCAVYSAHFFIRLAIWPSGNDYWTQIAAGAGFLIIGSTWLMKNWKIKEIYSESLLWGGLSSLAVPLIGVLTLIVSSGTYLPAVVVFAIIGMVTILDGFIRDVTYLKYTGGLSFVFMIWTLLGFYQITELQAYIIPLGALLLGAGWYEKVRYNGRLYRLFTILGCLLLLGTAFYQSIPQGAWKYALLVGIESLAAIIWGIKNQTRGYVRLGGIALIANSLTQFIPSFLEWSRWMQIGLTGTLLLGMGLVALFMRERLLETRKKLTTEWQSWEP